MTFGFLVNPAKVVDWARKLVTDLNQRDAQVQKQIDDIKARLDAGGL